MVIPILRKELLGSGRSGRGYAVRAAYLVLLSCVTLSLLASFVREMRDNPGFAASSRGQEYTLGLGLLQIVLVLLLAPALTIGSITSEKASGVLDLLHVAGVSPWQIVLGKFTARMAWLSLCIVSALPLLFTGTLMGGAGAETVGLIFANALACGALGTAIGLSISGFIRHPIPGLTLAYVLLFGLHVVPVLGLLQGQYAYGATPGGWMLASPFFSIPLSSAGQLGAGTAWIAITPTVGLALLCLLPAIRLARPSPEGARVSRMGEMGIAILEAPLGPFRDVRTARSAFVSGNPVAWRESRTARYTFALRLLRLIYLSLGGAVAFTAFGVGMLGGYYGASGVAVVFTLALAGGVVALVVSSTAITSERESRALPLLKLSRLAPEDILLGKLEGIALFLWPLAILPVIPALASGSFEVIGLSVIATAVLLFEAAAVGLFFSSWNRRSIAAVGLSVSCAVVFAGVLPFAAIFMLCPPLSPCSPSVSTALIALNPVFTMFDLFHLGEKPSETHGALLGLLFMMGLGVVCLFGSAWKLGRPEESA